MWVLKLSEYDFEIEHKAGKKHVNADCLSVATEAGNRKLQDGESSEALTYKTFYGTATGSVLYGNNGGN
jgi:hypothetical protein